MNLGRTLLFLASLILPMGLIASIAPADPDREGAPKATTPEQDERAVISKQPAWSLSLIADADQEQRERMLRQLSEQAQALKKEIEAGQRAAAKPAEKKEEGLRIFFNGQEIKLGEGKVLVVQEGKAQASPREKAEGGKEREDGLRIIINGREVKLGEGQGGEGKPFVFRGELSGQPALGRSNPMPGTPNPMPGAPKLMPGAANPPMPGGPNPMPGAARPTAPGATGWQAVPGGAPNPYGAAVPPGAAGQPAPNPGRTIVLREQGEREAAEARPRAGFAAPGGTAYQPGAPLPPGASAWGQPMPKPGAPMQPLGAAPQGAGAPGQPFRPNVAAEQMQQFGQMMGMLHMFQGICFDPGTAAMTAVAGIKDENPRRPEAAIRVLESSLRKVRTPGLRTAIHMTLKDLYKAQGNEEMVLEHLGAILVENDQALQEQERAKLRASVLGEKASPSHKMKAGGKKQKDKDDGDDKDEDDDD